METQKNEGSGLQATTAPHWAQSMRKLNDWMLFNIGGGPRPFKLAWIINLQKGGSFFLFGFLMWYYADKTPWATSTAAWVYLALHGSYGLVWLLKDIAFPDPNWQPRCTIPSAIWGFIGLALYWMIGWLLISGIANPHYPLPDNAWFALCISICLLGCVIVFGADTQKYVQLRAARGLITNGMFTYIRHPNYLGEMMIYGSFALMTWHWLPVLVLAYYWGTMFAVNMVMKEASMSRYPTWAAYKKRSWWLIPGIF
ncbi:methyltransferase family protein [Aquirhabdus sp.]|uniref:methyltransferase family protein n=1 Tax=Aquirhabdus sp. TaxID=2824160 RepID=UPI00396CEB3F